MTLPDIPEGEAPLVGWKEIARFLHRSVATVQRWEKELALPVGRSQAASFKPRVSADPRELQRWLWRQAPKTLTLDDVDRALEAPINTDDAFCQFLDVPEEKPAVMDLPDPPAVVVDSAADAIPCTDTLSPVTYTDRPSAPRFGRPAYAALILGGLFVLWAALGWAH